MLLSSLITIAAIFAPTLALPSALGLDKRQHVNTDWIVTGWTASCQKSRRTATFSVGAPDAYISGFYGFSVRCDVIPYNAFNYSTCGNFGSYRINAKLSDGSTAGATNISLIHTQIESNKVSIASGSAEVVPSSFFTVTPTDVRIGI
ncbi:hypothetical protein HD806DRAFT_505860 [Xylariaceae sp. AK1471]|nr:hypothetical protein HD806DRAFT_505860 [Xylariaceae sp. AK1471]